MPYGARLRTARAAVALLTLALAGGCFFHGEVPEQRPLSPAELAVQIVPGQMNVSIGLQKHCRPVGAIQRFQNDYDIRVATVAAGGNVAQYIQDVSYQRTENNTVTASYAASDVRFWACPIGPQAVVPVPAPPPPPLPPAPAE
jgi:hypothetical protein